MNKAFTIALREYEAAVKTKTFIISLVIMPIFMVGSIAVQLLIKDQVDVADHRVAIVDGTGELYDVLAKAAKKRNSRFVYGGSVDASAMPVFTDLAAETKSLLSFDDDEQELRFSGQMTEAERDALLASCSSKAEEELITKLHKGSQKQTRPFFVLEEVKQGPSSASELRNQLKKRVADKELFGFVIIDADAITSRDQTQRPRIIYYTARTTYRDVRNWMTGPLGAAIRKVRMNQTGLDAEAVAWATQSSRPVIRHIRTIDAEGSAGAASEANEIAELLIPFGMMMLMFMAIMVGATPLVHSVLEEKMQKISEVLVASVSPFELMAGKLIGVVGVSLTIVGVYVAGGYATLHHYGYDDFVSLNLLVWFLIYQSLAVVMFGALFIAIGAACADIKESQSMLTPVMLLGMFPLFIWLNVIREPNSSFSVIASFIPTGTPMMMMARLAAEPDLPFWQLGSGVLLVLATTTVFVWAAGRIFRVGILMQGKGAKIGEMIRWVVKG